MNGSRGPLKSISFDHGTFTANPLNKCFSSNICTFYTALCPMTWNIAGKAGSICFLWLSISQSGLERCFVQLLRHARNAELSNETHFNVPLHEDATAVCMLASANNEGSVMLLLLEGMIFHCASVLRLQKAIQSTKWKKKPTQNIITKTNSWDKKIKLTRDGISTYRTRKVEDEWKRRKQKWKPNKWVRDQTSVESVLRCRFYENWWGNRRLYRKGNLRIG